VNGETGKVVIGTLAFAGVDARGWSASTMEVSPYLTGELGVGDELELRGPIGGYFTWRTGDGGPLLLIAGGSGLVPLMAMLRHRAANGSTVDGRLLVSSRSPADVLSAPNLQPRQPTVGSPSTTHSRARRPLPGRGSPGGSTRRCCAR
jgi:ferredoxin-NADP reductase